LVFDRLKASIEKLWVFHDAFGIRFPADESQHVEDVNKSTCHLMKVKGTKGTSYHQWAQVLKIAMKMYGVTGKTFGGELMHTEKGEFLYEGSKPNLTEPNLKKENAHFVHFLLDLLLVCMHYIFPQDILKDYDSSTDFPITDHTIHMFFFELS